MNVQKASLFFSMSTIVTLLLFQNCSGTGTPMTQFAFSSTEGKMLSGGLVILHNPKDAENTLMYFSEKGFSETEDGFVLLNEVNDDRITTSSSKALKLKASTRSVEAMNLDEFLKIGPERHFLSLSELDYDGYKSDKGFWFNLVGCAFQKGEILAYETHDKSHSAFIEVGENGIYLIHVTATNHLTKAEFSYPLNTDSCYHLSAFFGVGAKSFSLAINGIPLPISKLEQVGVPFDFVATPKTIHLGRGANFNFKAFQFILDEPDAEGAFSLSHALSRHFSALYPLMFDEFVSAKDSQIAGGDLTWDGVSSALKSAGCFNCHSEATKAAAKDKAFDNFSSAMEFVNPFDVNGSKLFTSIDQMADKDGVKSSRVPKLKNVVKAWINGGALEQ